MNAYAHVKSRDLGLDQIQFVYLDLSILDTITVLAMVGMSFFHHWFNLHTLLQLGWTSAINNFLLVYVLYDVCALTGWILFFNVLDSLMFGHFFLYLDKKKKHK
jgi:hypothetical protein